MEREGRHRGHAGVRGHRQHEERPLIIELAQLLLDLYRVWESLLELVGRMGWRKEQANEDRSGV